MLLFGGSVGLGWIFWGLNFWSGCGVGEGGCMKKEKVRGWVGCVEML